MSESRALGDQILCCRDGRIFAVPAEKVEKVVAAPPIVQLPFLPTGVAGLAGIGGKAIPVLAISQGTSRESELLIVRQGADEYALGADRVMKIAGKDDPSLPQETPVLWEIENIVAGLHTFHESSVRSSPEPIAHKVDETDQLRVQAASRASTRQAALLVGSRSAVHSIPCAQVLKLCESLPTVKLPQQPASTLGAAFYRGALLPVFSLDNLLGAQPESEPPAGALVVTEVSGHACVLSVPRLIGITYQPQASDVLDLAALLEPILDLKAPPAMRLRQSEPASADDGYLLFECSGQLCGFTLKSVAHIFDAVKLCDFAFPTHTSFAGIAAVGSRILPVLDLSTLLELVPRASEIGNIVEIKTRSSETFGVLADKVLGIRGLRRELFLQPPETAAIHALADVDSKIAWILDPSLIAARAGRKLHAT